MPDVYPELFAWVTVDPTGRHGMLALTNPDTMETMPTISTKRHVMEAIRDLAVGAAKHTGLPVELRRYVMSEVLETVKP